MSNAALDYLLAQEWSMGNGQCPACHGMGPMVASFYPRKPDAHGHREDCPMSAAIAALSHAAGQDGEQCRAASGLDESEQRSLEQRAAAWDAVVATCLNIDRNALASYGPNGRESIVAFIRALSRGVPDGCDSSAGAPCGGFRTKHGEHFDILYRAFTYASATDAKRLDWLAHHGASLRNDCQAEGGGWFVIAPYHTGISSVDGRARFATARAAIDAAMEGDE